MGSPSSTQTLSSILPSILPSGPTQLVKQVLQHKLSAGDFAIDATAGNGHDTLTLAQSVGKTGQVWACDIQAQAIASTRALLTQAEQLSQVTLWQGSHSKLHQILPKKIKGQLAALVFNLGYLPRADHQLTTKVETTLQALENLSPLLKTGGICALTLYQGHQGGAEEAQAVESWASKLPRQSWLSWRASLNNVATNAPFSLMIERL